ncbi:YidC/Oxa1 family membrane protein insertase [Nocardioides sp. BE266]|uniref:membrane protein insertase YidC n=1 Tax=Nocardioides sp. BE266 TaxID=2817725 RepID=UPI00285CE726|nr:membrane protein insertase YidC [Nocardioides sp. BE266]MDR7253046.1 YidC/Oxa1 family membrane protein insertase [Nocardioides sp. BE266]
MLDFFGTIGGAIMTPLYYAVSFILVGFHRGLTALGLDAAGGWTWILSIVGLTLVVRTALIPLFVKQIKSSRNMQLIQPKVRELQKKYGHDRERLAQETMKLYKDSGTNPFSSCLPILLQMPIFLALFRMLDQAARKGKAHGFMDSELAGQFRDATFLGNIKVSGTLTGGEGGVVIVAAILVIAMTATTFMTQRQLMSKNMPADALSGPYAQQQKMLLYVLPVVFAVGGIAFPIGVLVYWTISNLWTMCQQFYVIRNNPAPGTPAAKAKEERDRAKGKVPAGQPAAEPVVVEEQPKPQRQQPQRQTKAQRSGGSSNKKKKR